MAVSSGVSPKSVQNFSDEEVFTIVFGDSKKGNFYKKKI